MDAAFQELMAEFLLEAEERTEAVESLLLALREAGPEARGETVTGIRRELHTLKGNAGMMGLTDLQRRAHALEDQVEALDLGAAQGRPDIDPLLAGVDRFRARLEALAAAESAGAGGGAAAATHAGADTPAETGILGALAGSRDGSVRVPFAKIDQLLEMLAETLILRNRLGDAIDQGLAGAFAGEADEQAGSAEAQAGARAAWERVDAARQAFDKTLTALQEYVTDLGMVPLRLLFRSLRRLVHDESQHLGKSIELTTEGGDTPIDKTLLEVAGDALGHLVRNAVAHGIEPAAERRRQGKPETGTIALAASIEGGEVRIAVRDDGAGIDLEALRALRPASVRRPADEEVDEDDLYALLFEEGVSTRAGEADLSAGRGVGLAAVKKSVEQHGGRVEVRSERHRGSIFVLSLPLTASILRSLLLTVDGEPYALPLGAVAETLPLVPRARHEINRAGVLRYRGRVTPILDLGVAFATTRTPREAGFAVIIEAAGRERALAVDALDGIRDIVVKRLDPIVGEPIGIAGSTILGDGRVVMLLDPTSLVTLPPSGISER